MLTLGLQHGVVGLILPTLGVQELLVILLIAVLIFGGRKIPEIGKGLGEGIRQFKDSLKASKDEPEKKEEAKTPTSS
jgi:sec-independent protein translocase protein TatA